MKAIVFVWWFVIVAQYGAEVVGPFADHKSCVTIRAQIKERIGWAYGGVSECWSTTIGEKE